MKLSTSLVAVKKINSTVPRSNFLEDELNLAAELILQAEGIINPPVVRRISLESYEVVDGDFEYYAAATAREKDPRKGETIGVFIIEVENEEVLAEQVKVLRRKGLSDNIIEGDRPKLSATIEIESLLDKKLQPIAERFNQLLAQPASNAGIAGIDNKIQSLTSTVERLASIIEELIPAKKKQKEPVTGDREEKVNLQEASESEIKAALNRVEANSPHIKAALVAIKSWKSKEGLTWENLKKSTKSGKDKIRDFGNGTYQKLKDIGYI